MGVFSFGGWDPKVERWVELFYYICKVKAQDQPRYRNKGPCEPTIKRCLLDFGNAVVSRSCNFIVSIVKSNLAFIYLFILFIYPCDNIT